jgi:hypothetical protein
MNVIAFTTLFLGLVTGPQMVQVEIAESVASVELLLDGALVGTITEPPWSVRCDFGQALIGHELVAIAYNRDHHEIGRARQWINLPRKPAEIGVVITATEDGQRVARLSWQAISGEMPTGISVMFDDQPLPVQRYDQVLLPEHDPGRPHFLRVELAFQGEISSHLEVLSGAALSGQVGSELTAVPVSVKTRRRKLPQPAELDGCLADRGTPLTVAAVEEGLADIVIVADHKVIPLLDRAIRRRQGSKRPVYLPDLQAADQRLSYTIPFAEEATAGKQVYERFRTIGPLTGQYRGFISLLEVVTSMVETKGPQRLADAVAVAGLTASANAQRRAVILFISGEPEDASEHSPETVRAFLQSLHVPLEVWCPDIKKAKNSPWGQVRLVNTRQQLADRLGELIQDLERQHVVWVQGAHLPHHITLTDRARNITLVE